jgi:hypothetical protein
MANIACKDLVKGINPDCDALNKVGGVDKRVWIGQLAQREGYATNQTTKDIEGITMLTNSPPYTLHKFIGKRFKNSGEFPLEEGENVNTFNHTAILQIFYSTSVELEALEELANADDLFVIMQGNDGKILCFGMDLGLNATAGEGGTGVELQDSTAYTMTISGQEMKAPRYFNVTPGASLADNITYLDGISA